MENTVSFSNYKPTLTKQEIASEIFNEIMRLDPINNIIIIDLQGMISMTTQCAKTIFGELYVNLGPNVYFSHIRFKNMSDDVDMIISMGIENAIFTHRQ